MWTSALIRSLLFAVLFILWGEASAESISCSKCGRYIRDGKFVQAGDQYFHPEHFSCARCGKPIGSGQYFTRNGQIYDGVCFDTQFSLKCAWCGKTLEGEYRIRDDKNYHKSCYASNVAPKCGWCSEPILDSSITSKGISYHNKCYLDHIALRCGLCGEIIQGQYMTTFRGGAWHASHDKTVPACNFCLAPIDTSRPETFVCYNDKRCLCRPCRQTAVANIDEAKVLADSVAAILQGIGISVKTKQLDLRLVDSDRMAEVGGEKYRNQRGYTDFKQYSQMFGLFKDRFLKVYILDGMPRLECIGVLAHELTHAWLFSHGRTKTAPQLCEGSCNYASWLVLSQYPGDETDYIINNMMTDPDTVYGEGLRQVKAWVEKVGADAWVSYLQKRDKNPW